MNNNKKMTLQYAKQTKEKNEFGGDAISTRTSGQVEKKMILSPTESAQTIQNEAGREDKACTSFFPQSFIGLCFLLFY